MGHISVVALFAFLQFWAFLGVLAVFAQFLSFSGNLGVLRAIVSYREPDGLNWL